MVHWPTLPRANLKLCAHLHVRPKQPVCDLRCSTSDLRCRARSVVSVMPRCTYVESREHVNMRTWACGSLLCTVHARSLEATLMGSAEHCRPVHSLALLCTMSTDK